MSSWVSQAIMAANVARNSLLDTREDPVAKLLASIGGRDRTAKRFA